MARVLGLDFVALQVRDLERQRAVYEERMGLERAPQSPSNAVVFQTEPVPFAVREPVVDLDAVDKLGWGVALWFKCGDVQELHDSLEEAGVPIAREPFDGSFGRTFALESIRKHKTGGAPVRCLVTEGEVKNLLLRRD